MVRSPLGELGETPAARRASRSLNDTRLSQFVQLVVPNPEIRQYLVGVLAQ